MNEWGLKGTSAHQAIQCHNYFSPQIGPLSMCKNNSKAGERRKRGRERAELSNPKRTKGSFRCMVSIDRSPHPHSFIRRAGCHARLEFPGRCQPPLHPIGRAKRLCLILGSKFGGFWLRYNLIYLSCNWNLIAYDCHTNLVIYLQPKNTILATFD